jgi:hypothetical protein
MKPQTRDRLTAQERLELEQAIKIIEHFDPKKSKVVIVSDSVNQKAGG